MSAAARERPNWLLPLLVVVIGAFMSILDTSIVNIAVPTLEAVYGAPTDTVAWVITIYMLALGVVVPASGWLGERFGLKRVYLAALAIFTVGSALCGLSPTIGTMIGFRVLQAVGGGLIMPTTMAMIYRMVPKERIGTAMGIWGIAAMAAPAIGPTLGGYLVEYVDWRLIYYVNVPVGIAGIALAWLILEELPGHGAGPFDLGGFLLAGCGLFSLLLGLGEGQSWGWTSESIVLLLWASAVLLLLFVLYELQQERPLLDPRVFRYRAFSLAALLQLIQVVGLYAGLFYIPLFLQEVQGLGAYQAGLTMMPWAIVTGIMMPVSGRLFDRFGPRALAITGMAALGVSSILLSRLTAATPTTTLIGWMMLRGVGVGLGMMPITTAGMSAVAPAEVSRASAISNIIQRVSGALGLAVLTAFLQDLEALHLRHLANALSPMHPASLNFLGQVGSTAQGLGLRGLLSGVSAGTVLAGLGQQAFTQSVHDLFFWIGWITLFLAFLPLLFGRVRRAAKAEVSLE